MATGVGLRIAEDECTAAIVTDAGELRYIVREAILHMADDGDTVLGGEPPANAHSITGFVAAVGNPAGLPVDDGEAYRAEDLFATALFCLINQTSEFLSGPAEFYATHPGLWSTPMVQSLRDALDYLGLRSVVLVSESDLPSGTTGGTGAAFAYDAGRAALAAVLATPAGATPPDPGNSENSMAQTDVMPAIPAPAVQQQAYSQTLPAAGSPVTEIISRTPLTPVTRPASATSTSNRRRTPLLIAAAVLFGLALGGLGVAVLMRGDDSVESPPARDARSDQSTTSVSVAPPPIIEPSIVITRSVEPEPVETTTPDQPPAAPPPPTTESSAPTTNRSSARTTTRPLFPAPPGWMPSESDWTPPTFTVQIPTNR